MKSIFLAIIAVVYIYYPPLLKSWMQHMINLLNAVYKVGIQTFPSPRPVAIPMLKSTVYPTMYT